MPRTTIYFNALKRYGLWHFFSHRYNLRLVSEFPKSGGTWFCQMLADIIQLPFERNTLPPRFETAVLHGHHLFSRRFWRPVAVIRDGRDVIVSAYHHFLIKNEWNQAFFIKRNRRAAGIPDPTDVKNHLAQFIVYMFETWPRRPGHFSWSDFINSWIAKPGVPVFRYEDLRRDPEGQMVRAAMHFTMTPPPREWVRTVVQRYCFEKLAGRDTGVENSRSFLRKGIVGDWKNYFNAESAALFDRYAGEELIRAGYVKNHHWMNEIATLS